LVILLDPSWNSSDTKGLGAAILEKKPFTWISPKFASSWLDAPVHYLGSVARLAKHLQPEVTPYVLFLVWLLLLLLQRLAAAFQMKIVLEYQDQHGKWHRYQEKHNEGDAYRTAKARAKATGNRFRIVDGDGRLIDLIDPWLSLMSFSWRIFLKPRIRTLALG